MYFIFFPKDQGCFESQDVFKYVVATHLSMDIHLGHTSKDAGAYCQFKHIN
jgi:hypothetical protein